MDLSSLGESTCGIWTRRDALALMSPGQARAELAGGRWQVLVPGTYADAGHVPGAEQRAYAAVLASGGDHQPADGPPVRVAAAGRTAARYWRLPLIDDEDPATGTAETALDDVHVRGGGRSRATSAGRLRRHDLVLAAGDLRRLPSGLVVLSPLRTLVHCSTLLSHEALVCALDDALHRKLVTAAELAHATARCTGEPGAPALRRGVSAADARAESPAETLARLLLLPALPRLEPQVQLLDDAGWPLARFDLGDRTARLAVEADGKRGHAGASMVARDRRRDRVSEARGWRTERVTWWELRREQVQVVRRVAQTHREQLARPRTAA